MTDLPRLIIDYIYSLLMVAAILLAVLVVEFVEWIMAWQEAQEYISRNEGARLSGSVAQRKGIS